MGDAARLEELVQDLQGRDGAYSLMREHLEAARVYLVGSMPREYEFSLKLVEELLPDIGDKTVHDRIDNLLGRQK